MAYKFAYTAPDGGSVTIVGGAPKQDLERLIGNRLGKPVILTDEEYKAHIVNRMMEAGTLPNDAVLTELPEDWTSPDGNRAYRGAWKLNGAKVEVDMPKARAIHMDYIRNARARKLTDLDNEWMRAAGQKRTAEADAIEAQRQKLRDIPQTFDLSKATTADELKALWPDELK